MATTFALKLPSSMTPNLFPSAERLDADARLLGEVIAGDTGAARVLVDRHLGSITRFAFRMLHDASEAEDVAQETFLRLWQHAPRWEPRASIGTWLHRVAHNLCVDRLRSRRTVRSDESAEAVDPRDEASTQLAAREQAAVISVALSDLPERQRAAIALVYYEGMSNQQAAEVLGIHVDGVESLLVRARRNLRARLQRGHAAGGGGHDE